MAWFRSLIRVSGIKPKNRAPNPFSLASLASLSTEATNKYSGLGPTVPAEKPRVVVVGSGWAACRLMKGLDTNLYDVVCVSPRNHMVFTPLLASTCVGTLEFRSVAEPISRIQPAISREPGSYFFLANCTGIDGDNHSVHCETVTDGPDTLDPWKFKIAYDKLVIALGAQPLTFGIQGVKEHAIFLREVYHAQEIRRKLLLNLMLSDVPGISEEEKSRLLHCVVVGGGPTGVEFSGELSEFITKDVRQTHAHVKDYIHVTLIEANETLSSFDDCLRHYATKQLTKVLNKLKVLNLSYSKNLTKSPYFLRVPRLEMLILEGCINLVELHESIGHLKHLVLLNLNECNNLRNLPRSISNLESLERLNFSGSTGRFPQSWLSSFSLWISPKSLLRASVSEFFYLGKLVLSNSNLFEDDIAIDFERLCSLQFLDLSYNNFRNLPYCISHLPKLKFFILNHCMSLESISGLLVNVVSLLALGCSSMERLSILLGSKIRLLFLVDCCKLVEIQGLPLDSGGVFNLFGCYNLSSDFRASLSSFRRRLCSFHFPPW